MINFLKKKKIKIICPPNRVDNYLAYSGHVFDIEKVKFFRNCELLDTYTELLFIDQKNLIDDNLNNLINKKVKIIIILLWNSDRDYFFYKKKINFLKKYFKVKMISFSNFSRNIYFPLNEFSIKKNTSLKKIYGIGIIKKIKFYFPKIYGAYNFLKYFKDSKNFIISKKLVFVGIGDKRDAIIQLQDMQDKNYSIYINSLCETLIGYLEKLTYKQYNLKFYKIFNSKKFQSIPISIKYYLTQISFRYLILSHLLRFKNFYHKNNSSYPLDLLRTNIYKNIFHLDLGSQSGNTKVHTRNIYLLKFFEKKYFDLNIFKNNENYNDKSKFIKRYNMFFNKLNKFYEFEKFSAEVTVLINELKRIR